MKRWLSVALVVFLHRHAAAEETPKITFDQAVREAIKSNPQAAKAVEQIHRSEALLVQARAASLPTLNASGQYTRLDGDRFITGNPVPIVSANTINLQAAVAVPLVNARGWVSWMHAGDQIDVAKASSADVARAVAITAARAYLTVLAQHRVVESSARSRDTAKAHVEFAKGRLAAGIGNKIDEVRAAQQLAQAELQLQNANINLVRSQEALGVLLGRDGPVDVATEPALGSVDAPAALGAVSARADVRAAGERLRAAHNVKRDGWTDYLPTLTGQFIPFYQEPKSLTQPQTGWQALLVLSVPLYDGGFRYGAQRERASNAEQARIDYEATLRQAKSEVRAAIESLRIADEALAAARDNAALAAQALELANTAYRAGATTNLEVIDAERAARDAETQVAVAEDASRQARLDLLAASGHFP